MASTGERTTWTNWAGNQSFDADRGDAAQRGRGRRARPRAIAAGTGLRAAGTGHSFTPLMESDGTVLDTSRPAGITHIDAARRRVTALPGTTVGEFGEPLWTAGLALANQGDIDMQAIAGAIATGTHGSGNELPSFSATLRALPPRRRPRRGRRDRRVATRAASAPRRSRSGCSA